MAPTPPKPANTFEEGVIPAAQQSKDALVKIVAEQGQYGLQQLANRDANAQQTAAAAAPPPGAARDATTQALYDVFTRDGQQSQAQHGQEMQRIQAANTAYMDQAYGGIALQKNDMDAYYEAMRRSYEDREAQRQAEMADRAASRAAARSGGKGSDLQQLAASVEGSNPAQLPFSVAQQLGKKQPNMDLTSAFKAIGMNDATIASYMKAGTHKKHERLVNDIITTARAEDMTWDQIIADARVMISDPAMRAKYGLKTTTGNNKQVAGSEGAKSGSAYETEFLEMMQPLLLMYAGDWGMTPEMWVKGYGAAPYAGPTRAVATKQSPGAFLQSSKPKPKAPAAPAKPASSTSYRNPQSSLPVNRPISQPRR